MRHLPLRTTFPVVLFTPTGQLMVRRSIIFLRRHNGRLRCELIFIFICTGLSDTSVLGFASRQPTLLQRKVVQRKYKKCSIIALPQFSAKEKNIEKILMLFCFACVLCVKYINKEPTYCGVTMCTDQDLCLCLQATRDTSVLRFS